MKHSFKTAMLVVTTSFMCSMTTSACTNTNSKATIEDTLIATDSSSIDTNLFTVSNRTVTPTDFTYAAEQTINGVVSIKSYATPRTSRYSNDAFSDPFFDFFFGNLLLNIDNSFAKRTGICRSILSSNKRAGA